MKAPFKIRGKVIANTGDIALVLLSTNDYTIAHRGYLEFSDMFTDEFLKTLPVGLRVICEQSRSGIRLLEPESVQ